MLRACGCEYTLRVVLFIVSPRVHTVTARPPRYYRPLRVESKFKNGPSFDMSFDNKKVPQGLEPVYTSFCTVDTKH